MPRVLIKQKFPEAGFVIPVAQGIGCEPCARHGAQRNLAAAVVEDSFHQVLDVCDLVLVASGTATLETALMGKPMIIIYKVSPLTYLVGRLHDSRALDRAGKYRCRQTGGARADTA